MINHTYKAIFIEVPKTASTRNIFGNPEKPHLDAEEVSPKADGLVNVKSDYII